MNDQFLFFMSRLHLKKESNDEQQENGDESQEILADSTYPFYESSAPQQFLQQKLNDLVIWVYPKVQ